MTLLVLIVTILAIITVVRAVRILELAAILGGEKEEIDLSGNPTVILMSGLQGSGKTTLSGKLANFLKSKKQKHPLLVACDVYRPAAIDQLHVVGESVGVTVFSDRGNTNAVVVMIAERAADLLRGRTLLAPANTGENAHGR